MNCDHCEFRVGCHIRKSHEDGTATFSCGMDFGSGNAKQCGIEADMSMADLS